jgi:hypothetical protein
LRHGGSTADNRPAQKVAETEITVATPVPSFVRHLRAENKAKGTIVAYLRGTDGLAPFLAEHGMPQEVASVRRGHRFRGWSSR